MAASALLAATAALACVLGCAAQQDEGSQTVWLSGRPTQVSRQPPEWDRKGYVLAFPCQGRFGNQMDYLLGGFSFSVRTGRVPPPPLPAGPLPAACLRCPSAVVAPGAAP
eukprot:SAG22_NODE_5695_length_970_cov_1.191734_2_plen_110_part_00